jgi:hypothetical protein
MAKPPSTIEDANPSDLPVLIDLYKGAYGWTLRVDVQSRARLKSLRDTFKALAKGTSKEVVISDGPKFRVTGLDVLRLVLREQAPLHKHLTRIESAGRIEYLWAKDSEGWKDCVGLVSGLLRDSSTRGPGHQYLTEEGRDDALVELAFGESVERR